MNCEKCNKEIVSNSVFCGNCGNKVGKENAGMYKLIPTTWEKRLVNEILDGIFSVVFMFCMLVLAGIISGIAKSNYLQRVLEDSETFTYSIMIILLIIYYSTSEYIWAKTPAKFFTNTTVVTNEGGRPDFVSVIKRTLIRFIPIEYFSFLSSRPVGWHDRWAKTMVVDDKDNNY